MSRSFRLLFSISMLLIALTSCNLGKSNNQDVKTPTEEEKAEAVKEVLKQGLNKAIATLSSKDGFLSDDSLKIAFPDNIQAMIENIKKLPMGKTLVDNAMKQINQVAGSSIEAAAPIINAAIDSMSVIDVNRILLADNAAATEYLENVSRKPIHIACEPIITQSLDKALIGNITTRNTLNALVDSYNNLAESNVGKITDLKPVEMEIDKFVTEKMLDAVFYLIAKEEMNIRKHPGVRIGKSMAKSFGWIDKKKE